MLGAGRGDCWDWLSPDWLLCAIQFLYLRSIPTEHSRSTFTIPGERTRDSRAARLLRLRKLLMVISGLEQTGE